MAAARIRRLNKGYGWTQLWMADAEGQSRQLVYGEDRRHVYGGHVSPDGQYVLFTGNIQEDGDPERAGAPMGLMRLEDAPIILGPNRQLRALYPGAKAGPVLTLPPGWEPCWTRAEIFSSAATRPTARDVKPNGDDAPSLARELQNKDGSSSARPPKQATGTFF